MRGSGRPAKFRRDEFISSPLLAIRVPGIRNCGRPAREQLFGNLNSARDPRRVTLPRIAHFDRRARLIKPETRLVQEISLFSSSFVNLKLRSRYAAGIQVTAFGDKERKKKQEKKEN